MSGFRAPLQNKLLLGLGSLLVISSTAALWPAANSPEAPKSAPEFDAKHFDEVQRAEYCASCHPAEVAEHRANTHGTAFTDNEVRLATGRFSLGTCISCHTPRPVFETGIGMNPQKRMHHLEEGNSCLTCHQRGGYDISKFKGGAADCKNAFDPRVGTVEACASCHKNHGTPYQWENAVNGKLADRQCVDCHMPFTVRAPAVGEEPRKVRRHTYYASHSESQIRKAYSYETKIDGNEVVAILGNRGAGHNFPTELKQRSVESLIVVKDADGKEVARSRKVYRDPYKRPYGLNLPVNTQIPSGESREHRVPISVAQGTVETSLYYKLYFPIEDEHPSFTYRLENRLLPFSEITPSTKPVDNGVEIHAVLPEALPAEAASPANLADFPHPKIGKVEVDIPDGTHPGDIEKLVSLMQFPVLEANRKAVDVLVSLGEKAVPALIDGLGSWDNKTFAQSADALVRLNNVAKPKLLEALNDSRLYVRIHTRDLLHKIQAKEAEPILVKWLNAEHPLDRKGAAAALGNLGCTGAAAEIAKRVSDNDPDVATAAALALAKLNYSEAIPTIRESLQRWPMIEARKDFAYALAALGEPAGVSVLLDGLDYPDDLIRESIFEYFFAVTGKCEGYHALMGREYRLPAIARLRAWWEKDGGKNALRKPHGAPPFPLRGEIEKLVSTMGGNDFIPDEPEKSKESLTRLIEIGQPVIHQVVNGLKWPAGFAAKRSMLCQVLAAVPNPDAVPALIEILEESTPVYSVAFDAVLAVEAIGDPVALPALKNFEIRFESLIASGRAPASLGSVDSRRVQIAQARHKLGDDKAVDMLLRIFWVGDGNSQSDAEKSLRKIVEESPKGSESVVKRIESEIDQKTNFVMQRVEQARGEWETQFEAANQLSTKAKTPQEFIEVLKLYEIAGVALNKISRLDANLYARSYKNQCFAEDDASERLYRTTDFEANQPWVDMIANGKGIWNPGYTGLKIEAGKQDVLLTQPESASNTGYVSLAPSLMRDYAVEMEFTLEAGTFECYQRYDYDQRTGYRVPFASSQSSEDSIRQIPLGKKMKWDCKVYANLIAESLGEASAASSPTQETRIGLQYRKGGIVLALAPGAKLRLTKFRLKSLR